MNDEEYGDDDIAIVCGRITGLRPVVPGSQARNCTRCRTAIWLSPRSQDLQGKARGPVQLLCQTCAADLSDVDSVDVVPGAADELAAATGILSQYWEARFAASLREFRDKP